jgi:hypothetical protein
MFHLQVFTSIGSFLSKSTLLETISNFFLQIFVEIFDTSGDSPVSTISAKQSKLVIHDSGEVCNNFWVIISLWGMTWPLSWTPVMTLVMHALPVSLTPVESQE